MRTARWAFLAEMLHPAVRTKCDSAPGYGWSDATTSTRKLVMPLNPKTVSRLAFIRFLHHQGVQQSRLPEPQSSASVMTLHDAVEAFLLLAGRPGSG
jgi:hypothetical protein